MNLFALIKFNLYFKELINTENITISQRRPTYDLTIQQQIITTIVNEVLPILSDENYLVKYTDEAKINSKDRYDFSFVFQEEAIKDDNEDEDSDTNELYKITQKENYDVKFLKGLVYEVCLSFLKLFNMASSRMYFSTIYN